MRPGTSSAPSGRTLASASNTGTAGRVDAVLPRRGESGMSTAEYAVGTVGACGFAGLLYQLLTSDFGRNLLSGLFEKVLDLLPF
ncbi:MAG TPA: DUF4244 domain-containing protein [Nocardioidaceae bacterium]|jgi:hypothetical protein